MQDKDYYSILGLDKSASQESISTQYRKLAKTQHPDLHKDNKQQAEKNFKEITEAYELLSDPQKRQMYDQYGVVDGQPGPNNQNTGFGDRFANFNPEDIFNNAFFNGGFQNQRQQNRNQFYQDGEDLQLIVELDLKEVLHDVERTVKYNRKVMCADCRGTGQKDGTQYKTCTQCNGKGQNVQVQQTPFGSMQQISDCGRCKGTGKIIEHTCIKCSGYGRLSSDKEINITIPSGADENVRLKITGGGNGGRNGGRDGDLHIILKIRNISSKIKRQGKHLYSNEKIGYLTAILGGEISIDTLTGKKKIHIKPGTQPNEVIVIKDNGLPDVQTKLLGDLNVTIQVEIPKNISDKERSILEQLQPKGGKLV